MTTVLTDDEVGEMVYAFGGFGQQTQLARAIEAAVLAKFGEPDAWQVFDGEGGYDYFSYTDNEDYRENFIKRNPQKIYKDWVIPLYALKAEIGKEKV